jgi:drug/metabolite transporter (DMT)-like permease
LIPSSGAIFLSEHPLERAAVRAGISAHATPHSKRRIHRPPSVALRIDLLLLVAINFMWALKWTISKVALRQLDPVSITLFPMIGAILLLLPVLRKKLKGQPAYLGIIRKEACRPANIFRFLLLGVAGQAACQVLVSLGLKYVSATDAALISLSVPILIAILAVIIVGESLSWRLFLSFVFAIAGVLLIVGVHIQRSGVSNWYEFLGVLLLLGSSLGAAFYNAYGKKLLVRFLPAEILFYSYIFVVISLYPLHRLVGKPLSIERMAAWHWQMWISLGLLSLFVYWLSMVLFFEVLTRRSLAPVSVSIYLMTVFGVLISTITLREPLTSNMIIGGALVCFGTIIASLQRRQTES